MKKLQHSTVFTFAVALIAFTLATTCSYAYEIAIDVSPNVLNIQSESVVVTIHTDIAYGAVDVSSVFLNGVLIDHWKSDNRGNFVAKFLSDEIKTLDGLITGDYNTLTMVGADTDGGAFIGTQDIMVINNIPAGKN
jgi:hypothetical protein